LYSYKIVKPSYVFTGIDSSLSDNFGRSIIYGLSAFTTLVTISVIGGLPFLFCTIVIGSLYYNGKSTVFLEVLCTQRYRTFQSLRYVKLLF